MPPASGNPCSDPKRTAIVAASPAGSQSSASGQNPRRPIVHGLSMPGAEARINPGGRSPGPPPEEEDSLARAKPRA